MEVIVDSKHLPGGSGGGVGGGGGRGGRGGREMRLLATLLNECTAIHVQYEWLAGKRQTIEEGLTIQWDPANPDL